MKRDLYEKKDEVDLKNSIKNLMAVCMMLLVLMLCACGGSRAEGEKVETPSSSAPAIEESSAPAETKEETVIEPELLTPTITVQDLYYNEGDYTDSVGNEYHYRFQLPVVVGAGTEYIENINREVSDIFDHYVQSELDSMEQLCSLVTLDAHYSVAVFDTDKGALTSILLTLSNDWGQDSFRAYNLDANGNEATIEEILKVAGISEDEYLTEIRIAAEYLVGTTDGLNETFKAMVQEVNDRTLSSENINEETPIFLTAYGRLGAIIKQYSMAGADYYEHAILTLKDGFGEEEICDLVMSYARRIYGSDAEYAEVTDVNDGIMTVELYKNKADNDILATYTVLSDIAEIETEDYNIQLYDIK